MQFMGSCFSEGCIGSAIAFRNCPARSLRTAPAQRCPGTPAPS